MPTVTIHIDAFFSVVFDYSQLIPTKVYDGTPKYSVLVIYIQYLCTVEAYG
jgi:hypothetical protein